MCIEGINSEKACPQRMLSIFKKPTLFPLNKLILTSVLANNFGRKF